MFTPSEIAILEDAKLLETAQLCAFGARLLEGFHDALKDDGKISIWETVGVAVRNVGDIKDALTGLEKLPGELSQLTGGDIELLGGIIFPAVAKVSSGYVTELVNCSLGIATQTAHFLAVMRAGPAAWNTPVKAQPVEE